MKERAAELRAEKGGKKAAAALDDLLTSIAAMPEDQRVIAERVHAIVTEAAPALLPKTWYGQPAWTNPDGKEASQLDEGVMWPTSHAGHRPARRRRGAEDRTARAQSGRLSELPAQPGKTWTKRWSLVA